jgi:dienelactone hydrolase
MLADPVTFMVDGQAVVGRLHRPTDGAPRGALLVAGPMTSVKEQVTGVYAAALAERGFAALAIDHRHFGESEGQPRGLEDWPSKVADLRAAFAWLAAQAQALGVTRLGGVGICLGCGYMAYAAADTPEVRALGLVAGYYRDPQAMRAADPAAFDAKVAQGRAAREAYETSGEVWTIPAAAASGDAAMSTADTVDYYCRRAAHPNYRNAFAVMSRERFLPFDVQAIASRVTAHTLMVHAPKALSPAWAEAFAGKLAGPSRLEWLDSQGQTDFYDDPRLVGEAADGLARHFAETWGAPSA